MVSSTVPGTDKAGALVVSLDVGSTSVRTLLFDAAGNPVPGFGAQIKYRPIATEDGGWEVDPRRLLQITTSCLTTIHDQLRASGRRAAGIAICTFWHSFFGLDERGRPSTRIFHLFDTRSSQQAEKLKTLFDETEMHARTGCVFHTSYWPAKLLWLRETQPSVFCQTRRWISFGEYLLERVGARAISSTSMVSASGIWNPNEGTYEKTLLAALEIDPRQLASEKDLDEAVASLRPDHKSKFPDFDGIPWYPALGDGACNNVGSGCVTPDRFALMVGTSGAMRSVVPRPHLEIRPGVWCYRVDRKRFVLGGALSNGGYVYDKMTQMLRLPPAAKLESEIAAMEPGSHNLTALPFFNGERSTRWNSSARAAFTGISHTTTPVELLRAAMESVALRFRLLYTKMCDVVGTPEDVIATGSALENSAAWTQMMADALGRRILLCGVRETSSRGAALLALERLGVFPKDQFPKTAVGARYEPDPARGDMYNELLRRQEKLYGKLFLENQD